MVISDKHKYFFCSMPKAGTHLLYHLLTKYFDGIRLPHDKSWHHTIAKGIIPAAYKDYYKFSIVTNPFRRAVSCWKPLAHEPLYAKQRGWAEKLGGKSFLQYTRFIKQSDMKHFLIASQSRLFGSLKFDKILHLDNIQEEFNTLPFIQKKIEVPVIFSLNKFKNKDDWKKLYSPEAVFNVLTAWGEDFDKFNYEKKI